MLRDDWLTAREVDEVKLYDRHLSFTGAFRA